MAIPKVLGIETEYGIAGGPDHDPITASSIVVNAYAQQGRSRINWDFQGETPGPRRARPAGADQLRADRRDAPGQRGAHQRRAPLRRPRPPGVLLAGVPDPARGGRSTTRPASRCSCAALAVANACPRPGPGDHALQEQLRRQGQLLRLPRELPGDARRRVRRRRARDGAALRVAPDRRGRGQGRRRDRGRRSRRVRPSSSASARSSSRRSSASRRRSSARSSTPATSRTATPSGSAAST